MAVPSYGVFQEVGQLGGSVRHMMTPLLGQRQDYLQACISVGMSCSSNSLAFNWLVLLEALRHRMRASAAILLCNTSCTTAMHRCCQVLNKCANQELQDLQQSRYLWVGARLALSPVPERTETC